MAEQCRGKEIDTMNCNVLKICDAFRFRINFSIHAQWHTVNTALHGLSVTGSKFHEIEEMDCTAGEWIKRWDPDLGEKLS